MDATAYDWAKEEVFCATVITGLDVDGVCAAIGGTKRTGTVTGQEYFDTNFVPAGQVVLMPLALPGRPTTTFMLEYGGLRGVDDEVLARLAAGGYALSAFQNVNLLIFLYGAAREGRAERQTMSEDWALLRQLRVDEPLPASGAATALDMMRDIGFLTQERSEAMGMDAYLRENADFWPRMFEFMRRATGADLTTDLVLGPGYTVVDTPGV